MSLEELYIERNEYAKQGDVDNVEMITRQIDDMLPTKEKNVLILTERYRPEKYPKYENYNAINVDKVKDIPYDYDGVMGVPITFLSWYMPGIKILCPAEEQANHQSCIKLFSVPSCLKDTQFEILGVCEPAIIVETLRKKENFKEYKSRQIIVNGNLCQKTYHRLLIKMR